MTRDEAQKYVDSVLKEKAMTNTPKEKTPREVNIIESAEDGGFVAVYETFSGIGTTKEDAYRELCVALSLVVEVFEEELAAERQKARDSGYHAGYCAAKSKFEREGHCNYHRRIQREAEKKAMALTAENERQAERIKALEGAAKAYRDLCTCYRVGKAPSEKLWKEIEKAKKALASPTTAKRCDKCGWPLAKSVEEGCVEGNCSMRPVPKSKGDSAGPEKHQGYCPVCGGDSWHECETPIRKAEQDVIEAARKSVETFYGRGETAHYQATDNLRATIKALDRARGGEEKPAKKFALGDRVTKIKGSSWTGKVVGFYSTKLTPEGYAVESENEPGSVQIYPAAALERARGEGKDEHGH